MFGSEVLEVAIGLVLIFLLLSLFLTALVEVIESALKTRAADLERAVGLMLGGNNSSLTDFYEHPLVFSLFRGDYKSSRRSLFFWRDTGGKLPSYIPRDIFSTVVMELDAAGRPGNGAGPAVESYRRLSGDDLGILRANLESWYDAMMDRAAGWYKRRTQKLLFWLGLTLAIAFNINPIVVGQHLAAYPQARQQMVSLAENLIASEKLEPASPPGKDTENSGPVDTRKLRQFDQAVRAVGLPMGWNSFAVDRCFPPGQSWALALLIAATGWAMTAVAATLGAPFWFDVLNKLMVIRATVKPKEKSRDEASEDRARSEPRYGAGPAAFGQRRSALSPLARDADVSTDGHEDGCLDGHDVPDEAITHDVELPPATGGIKDRD